MTGWTFLVDGIPTPQGSTKGWLNPKSGKVQITHDNKAPLRSWRQDIAARARDAGVQLIEGPVLVRATFGIARPASVSAKRRPMPTVKPDLDKLARSLLDSLTGIAYADDAQVVALDVVKVYAVTPGMRCHVAPAAGAVVDVERAQAPQLTLEGVAS